MWSRFPSFIYLIWIVNMASITLGNSRLTMSSQPYNYSHSDSSAVEYAYEINGETGSLFLTPGTQIMQGLPKYLHVRAGTRLELNCTVIGRPSPRLFWVYGQDSEKQRLEVENYVAIHNNSMHENVRNLSMITSTLVIDCVNREHQGPVSCVSVSGNIEAESQMELTVYYTNRSEPTKCNESENEPTIILQAESVLADVNSTATLPCRFTGVSDFYWLDEESRIVNSTTHDRYTVLSNGDLQITNLQSSDMGSYTCVVKSGSTERHASTYLYTIVDMKVSVTEVIIGVEVKIKVGKVLKHTEPSLLQFVYDDIPDDDIYDDDELHDVDYENVMERPTTLDPLPASNKEIIDKLRERIINSTRIWNNTDNNESGL